MTLTELINEVYAITAREDLVAETKMAVKSATIKLHQTDFYYRDLFETGFKFDTEDYIQQVNLRSAIPRFRAISYLRKYDNIAQLAGKFFEVLTPTNTLDSWGVTRTDIAYAAGDVINIRSSTLVQYALLGVYLNPDITDIGYSSFIATDHPYAIVFEAARVLFKTIGFDEQSATYEKLVNEQVQNLKISNVQSVGY